MFGPFDSFVIILRLEVAGCEHLSSPLCIPFGKTDKSTVQLITIAFVSLYLLTILVADNLALNPIIFNIIESLTYFETNKQRVLVYLCDDC